MKNQTEFAEKLGITQTSLSKYENGTVDIPDEVKVKISKFGINLHWLITGHGDMFLEEQSKKLLTIPKTENSGSLGALIDQRLEKIETEIAKIKVHLKKTGAEDLGSGMFVFEPEPEYGEVEEDITLVEGVAAGKPIYQSDVRSTIRVPKRYIKTKPEDYYVGRIKGTSMTAAGIPDGCLVLFRISDVPRDGAIQVVERQGEATLKRIREIPGKGWKICFEDGSEKVIEIGPGDEFQIQGDFITVLPE
jgi:SOS-response transcriptional repressor LexA